MHDTDDYSFRMTDSIAVGLLEKLQQCSKASEDGDVDLETYINCWSSLNQILGVLGSVFRFVQSDVEDKGTLHTIKPIAKK